MLVMQTDTSTVTVVRLGKNSVMPCLAKLNITLL